MISMHRGSIAFVTALLAWGLAVAQVTSFDEEFVLKAASDNAAEIALGRLAQQQASDPAVKDFAVRVVQDHEQAAQELTSIVSSVDLVMPAGISAEHARLQDQLSGVQGDQFDRRYIGAMVQEHQKTVSLFERAANEADAPELQEYAKKTLPTLQDHLRMAQQVAAQLAQ